MFVLCIQNVYINIRSLQIRTVYSHIILTNFFFFLNKSLRFRPCQGSLLYLYHSRHVLWWLYLHHSRNVLWCHGFCSVHILIHSAEYPLPPFDVFILRCFSKLPTCHSPLNYLIEHWNLSFAGLAMDGMGLDGSILDWLISSWLCSVICPLRQINEGHVIFFNL